VPPDYLFEVSDEAARPKGLLYPVLRGKAPLLAKKFGDRYTLIGYYDKSSEAEIRPEVPPAAWGRVFADLRPAGVDCYHGRWLAGGKARVILLDAKRFGDTPAIYKTEEGEVHGKQVDAVKYALWKSHGIDSLMMGPEFGDALVWGHATGMLLEKLLALDELKARRGVAHFHEWTSGAGLLYARARGLPCATLFTTHATVLGKALASAGRDILGEALAAGERKLDLHEAYNLKQEGAHLLETAVAAQADAFTTNSETVAAETRYVLGKEADGVLVSGLSPEELSFGGKAGAVTRYVRSELEEFLEGYFAPYYEFSYEDSLLVFMSGRYEFRAKGYDLYIKALGRLNDALKLEPTRDRKVVAFIFAPSSVKGARPEVLHNYLLMDKIHEFVRSAQGEEAAKGRLGDIARKTSPRNLAKLQAMVGSFRKAGELPPVSCFELAYQNDAIESACRVAGLDNSPDDVVKVLYYPAYLRPGDGLLDLEYADVLSAMDAGAFPNRYEPLGHAAVESALVENVTLASDATGFGRYLLRKVKDLKGHGIRVLPVAGRSDEESANAFATHLRELFLAPRKKLEALQADARKLVSLLAWDRVLPDHLAAYDLALTRRPRAGNKA
jgi:glycogen(starch) synthase